MLEIYGLPPEKFDKLTFEDVKKELVEEKGVPHETLKRLEVHGECWVCCCLDWKTLLSLSPDPAAVSPTRLAFATHF